MKLFYFLIVAILAMLALSAQGKHKRSDIDLPPGAYWESDNVVVVRNDPLTWEELEEADGLGNLKARDEQSNQPQFFDNSTSSLATATKSQDVKYYADLWIAGDKQGVGTLRGDRLGARLYDCFASLCTIEQGKVNCWEQLPFDGPKCEIPNIVNNPGHRNGYDASASLFVTFRAVHHSLNLPNLELATYEMVAAMLKAMTQQASNCEMVDFKNSRRTTLCSIARQVLVVFPMSSSNDNPETLFIAAVTSTVPKDQGKYACDDQLRTNIGNYFNGQVRTKFAKATDRNEYEIGAHVRCVEDKCMSRDSWKDCVKDDK